ncbi:MAG: cbb3-type cytochrome c oxidase subunit II [Limisphaerales bacterium]
MNRGPLIFVGILLCVTLSWLGAVVVPHLQFGAEPLVVIEETGQDYPLARNGEALQGAEVYRANGCNYCHTQQVRPASEGGDLARGWGQRRTVARDYLRDLPPMLGQVRFGPDLANYGARETNTTSVLMKLYNARVALPGSIMPRYPYLFDVRKIKAGQAPSAEALVLPEAFAPPSGYEVVPKPEAKRLAAYLLSLRSDQIFYEVFPPLPPKSATNVVDEAGTGTNAPPAVSTNAPLVP